MIRLMMTVCLASVLAGGAMAQPADPVFALDPTKVNLLECWNPDGTYGWDFYATTTNYQQTGDTSSQVGQPVTVSSTRDNPLPNKQLFANGGSLSHLVDYTWDNWPSARFSAPAAAAVGATRWFEITYDFGSAVTIDTLIAYVRTSNAGPNFQWVDDKGKVIGGVGSDMYRDGDGTPVSAGRDLVDWNTHTIDPLYKGDVRLGSIVNTTNLTTPVTTTSLTFRMCLVGGNTYNTVDFYGLAAYATDDSTKKPTMDGTYNIFYYEDAKATVTGTTNAGAIAAGLTNHVLPGNTGRADLNRTGGGYCTWEFSQEYELYGMILTPGHTTAIFEYLKLEVSLTGEDGTWETIWYEANWNDSAIGNKWFANSESYVVFAPEDPDAMEALNEVKFLKLSWGEYLGGTASGTSPSINEFQLFGKPFVAPIPEPATMTLLVLGGLSLLRRRR